MILHWAPKWLRDRAGSRYYETLIQEHVSGTFGNIKSDEELDRYIKRILWEMRIARFVDIQVRLLLRIIRPLVKVIKFLYLYIKVFAAGKKKKRRKKKA